MIFILGYIAGCWMAFPVLMGVWYEKDDYLKNSLNGDDAPLFLLTIIIFWIAMPIIAPLIALGNLGRWIGRKIRQRNGK